MSHVFFASYARLDNDRKRLGSVILDLRERVRGRLGALDASKVGFFDSHDGILAAKDWEQTLGEAARHARVLVSFCSNTYFNSEYCANEFEVFRRRLGAWGGGGQSPPVILPVIWNRCSLPKAVSRYQDSAEAQGFPSDYRNDGLLALQRNKTSKSKARYNATLDALTTVIEQALAGAPLPPWPTPVVFDDLPGVFDNPGAYGVRAGALHPNGLRWELFPGTTLRALVEKVAAASHLPWRALKIGDDIAAQLTSAAADREAVVVVAHAASIGAGILKVRADVIDANAGENCRILVGIDGAPGRATPPETVLLKLRELFPSQTNAGRVQGVDVDALAAVEARIAEQIATTRMTMVAADPAERVTDATLAQAALEQGIGTATRPLVAGPDGRRP
jgi:TIR domain